VNGRELFDGLDDGLPLALLPVRLVTRFHRPDEHSPPTQLHLRIYPDVIHADAHDPALTEHEEQLGRAYWEHVAGGDEAVIADARARLAAQLDPYRALWVASATAGGAKPARSTGPRPTIARLLPARWLAIGYVNREEVDRWWSLPVTADLPMAPNLTALAEGDGVRAFLRKQGLQWMVDFEQAVQVGMGMKIPLDNVTATTGFEELIVVGVGDRDDDSATLAALMAAHRYTEGLDFVPQGAPTNNTDSVASAVTTDAPDLGALFEAEGGNPLPRGRPALTDPALLYRMRAANAASIALGLTAVNALDRAPNAGLMEGADAHAMNTALWWATVEYLLSSPLAHDGAPVLTRTQLNWLRKWFRDYVRGGAALPVMRIGTQPYGLLPVGAMPFGAGFWTPASSREWLEKTVADLFDTWVASREDAPALSPVPGGVRPSKVAGEEAVTVASVLGAVPHPMRFRLRDALDEFASRRDGWEDRLDGFEVLLDRVDVSYRTLAKNHYLNLEAEIRGNGGVSAQLSAVRQLRTEYQAEWTGNESQSPFRELNGHITKYLEPLLEAHDDRAKLRHLVSGLPTDAALPDSTDPRLWYVLYEPPGDEDAPALRLVEEDTAGLADALRRLADPPPGPPITIPASVPIPLMHRLVRRAFETPPADFVADLRAACRSLATIADRGADDLERLTAETLGLLTHRLDAWHASLAAERLALKRTPKAKQGVQVGGYGWVVNLAPDPTGEADTQGFIHAPSLAHAATAAVLRSAWSAFSTDASAAAFAVDLSSDRVRRAEWILGGVRNGQSLEELLGGRFERRLHDAARVTYIDVIRSAVLTAQGSRRPPSAIVDCLALAEAYADLGAPPDAVRTAVDAAIAGDDRRALETLLRQTAVDLDAASDALTAQAVHSVLTGDLAEAAAASAAMGSGDSGVPELRYAHVRRESDLVMHRVTALFGDDTPAAPSLLGTIEPALCAWVDRLLAGIGTATCRAGATTFPLSELKLTAYQLLALAGSGRLERLVAGYARRFKGQSDVAVELPAELDALVPLRRAIGRARPLGRHDLARDQIEPVPDLAELDVRRGQVITALTTLAQQKVNDVLLSSRLADLLTVDDAATLAALEADDAQERGRLLLSVTTRAAETANALGKGVEPADLAERLAAVSRIPITVLPRFTAGDPAGLRRAFANGDARAGSPLAIPGWLLQVGRVHAAAGLLHEGLGLIELVTGAARAAYGLAQLPDEAGEPWAAIGKPRGGRTCVVTVTDWRKPLGDTGISGLLFDAWTEPVPRRDVMTGVAVHFDSPSARPPQAVLLMTSPAFNVDEIVGILRDTLEMARCRAIGTETLADLGQYLPGLFLPEGYAVEGESAGADSVASSLREHRVEVSG
jgi:hypothetical protein